MLRQRVGTRPTLPILWQGCLREIAQDTQLWGLAQAALDFSEARELGQREHGVPQRERLPRHWECVKSPGQKMTPHRVAQT